MNQMDQMDQMNQINQMNKVNLLNQMNQMNLSIFLLPSLLFLFHFKAKSELVNQNYEI